MKYTNLVLFRAPEPFTHFHLLFFSSLVEKFLYFPSCFKTTGRKETLATVAFANTDISNVLRLKLRLRCDVILTPLFAVYFYTEMPDGKKKWRSKKRIPSLICHQRHPETGESGEAKLISVWPNSFVYHSSEGFKSTQWLRKRSLTLSANPNLTFSRANKKCSSDKSPPPHLTPPRKQQQQKNMYSFTCTAH